MVLVVSAERSLVSLEEDAGAQDLLFLLWIEGTLAKSPKGMSEIVRTMRKHCTHRKLRPAELCKPSVRMKWQRRLPAQS